MRDATNRHDGAKPGGWSSARFPSGEPQTKEGSHGQIRSDHDHRIAHRARGGHRRFARAGRDGDPPNQEVISESALLTGLGAGAAFPFIDTTPRPIVRAHLAVTDA